jgi:hypothetical protein
MRTETGRESDLDHGIDRASKTSALDDAGGVTGERRDEAIPGPVIMNLQDRFARHAMTGYTNKQEAP